MASGVSLRRLLQNSRNVLSLEAKLKGPFRTYLSAAYRCEDAWNKRFESPLVKNINLDDMYYDMDQKYQQEGIISAVDVDIFAAAVRDDTHLDELEDLVHRLRLSENAGKMLPATPHNLIRTYLATGNSDAMIRVLNDRLNYGIFPDHYTTNLLMDTFLKQQQYLEAAKIGILQMLQEDWEHPLTTRLSLLSCMKHLQSPKPWDSVGQSPEPEEEESKEEVKVRVKYLRNPYFDDHFDLVDESAIVGKTLAMLSPHLPSSPLSRTLELLGLCLRGNREEASAKLQHWKQSCTSEPVLIKQGVEMASNTLQSAEGDTALQEQLASMPAVNSELLVPLEEAVREAVSDHERSDIEKQTRSYVEWEKMRELELAKQLTEIDRQERLKKVEEKKKYLQEKEERLYFFDREHEWDLKIEENQPKYRKRWFGKKKKPRVLDEAYVPPEVGRGAN